MNPDRWQQISYRRVSPGLFLGLGLNVNSHSNVRPGDGSSPASDESPFLTYNRTHGFAPDRQTSSGASIGLLFDTRDNAINPQGGSLASAIYRTFGLRVLLNKRSRTNLAADFGWGKAGSRGFYLGIQEAF